MNDKLKPLAEFSAEQKTFLKQQLGTFVSKQNLQITRDQSRLDARLGRRDDNQEKLEQLQADLAKKQKVLTALKKPENNIDADIITSQEEDVAKTQDELNRLVAGPNTLTDVEAYLEQYEIEILKLSKGFYQSRFDEVAALG